MSAMQSLTLYELEDNLLALIESEDSVSEEQQVEYREELAEALNKSVDKRQRVGEFLRALELRCENIDSEIKRLRAVRERTDNIARRVRSYVAWAIESLGQNDHGKFRKLEGRTFTFSLRCNPASLDITNPEVIPEEYQDITVTLPLNTWRYIAGFIPDDESGLRSALRKASECAKTCINRKRIKDDLERGEHVEGADLQYGFSLVVR